MENITPIRIQRSRKHKQVSPNGLPIVYVGRPGKWGNPFKVGETIWNPEKEEMSLITPASREECVRLYEVYMRNGMTKKHTWIYKDLHELKEKNLSCWCKIGEKCHADVLLELANKI